jgi:hypothetical protein
MGSLREVMKMNNKSIVITMLALSITLSIGMIYSSAQNYETTHYIADWIHNFNTVDELIGCDDLDLIIVGEIIESDTYSQPVSTNNSFIIMTKHTIQVDELLLGKCEEIIYVHQHGGIYGNKIVDFEDDPLMTKGTKMVLFLHQAPTGDYYIIGGAQGRYELKDGKLLSLGETMPENSAVVERTVHLKINGLELNLLKEQINKTP